MNLASLKSAVLQSETHHALLQTGKLSNVWLGNISSRSEAGVVVSGYKGSIIENVVIKDTDLELTKTTKIEAGFLDFRPSQDDVVNASSIPALFVEYTSHIELSNFEASSLPLRLSIASSFPDFLRSVHIVS